MGHVLQYNIVRTYPSIGITITAAFMNIYKSFRAGGMDVRFVTHLPQDDFEFVLFNGQLFFFNLVFFSNTVIKEIIYFPAISKVLINDLSDFSIKLTQIETYL